MADETRADKWRLVRGTNLKSEDRHILLTLFLFQGHNGAAFCKQETLADEIGVSTRSIRTSLNRLNAAGIVVSKWQPVNSVPMRTYAIDFDKLKTVQRTDGRKHTSDPETVDGRKHTSAPVGSTLPDHQEAHFLQERSIEHPRKIHKGAALPVSFPKALDNEQFKAAWSEWIQFRREIKKKLPSSTIAKQLAKLATFGSAKAVQAIENSISNGWHGLFDPDDKQGGRASAGNSLWQNIVKFCVNVRLDDPTYPAQLDRQFGPAVAANVRDLKVRDIKAAADAKARGNDFQLKDLEKRFTEIGGAV